MDVRYVAGRVTSSGASPSVQGVGCGKTFEAADVANDASDGRFSDASFKGNIGESEEELRRAPSHSDTAGRLYSLGVVEARRKGTTIKLSGNGGSSQQSFRRVH